jgi:hypothetical protein
VGVLGQAVPQLREETETETETEPERLWPRLLQNQRGAVVAHAVRRETDAVICRLRFRLF